MTTKLKENNNTITKIKKHLDNDKMNKIREKQQHGGKDKRKTTKIKEKQENMITKIKAEVNKNNRIKKIELENKKNLENP